ncbi:MAG: type II CRISPR RNA-guided endonuclease Cas9 [Coriobacteriaceae bacterium]|nr:type II CRISPR RNA-guided endonuclease Cas9 [Coriobacteriaceae bacterium]
MEKDTILESGIAEKSNTVLGLDIGIGSCGWALLDLGNRKIINMGVRLWDVPQEPKTKTSCAATRRAARSVRRNTKRTRDRQKHCLRILISHGLVPEGSDAGWLQSKKGDKPIIKLRKLALKRRLSKREFAQILYSISAHRGYIPHGEGDVDVEGKKVKKAIESNALQMSECGAQTIGQFLALQPRSRNRSGDYSLCVSNQQLIDEVCMIFARQKEFGSGFAADCLLGEYLECMTWEKDTKDRDARIYGTVGMCTYFPDEKRAARACLSSELCSAYERVCHAVVVDEYGNEHPIPLKVRRRIIETLFSPVPIKGNKECKVSYSRIRQWIDETIPDGVHPDCCFKGIDRGKEKNQTIFEPKAWAVLRKSLDASTMWQLAANRHLADEICSAVTYASSRSSLEERVKAADLGLSDSQYEQICNLPYSSKVFNGYGSRSLKALDMLIGAFEEDETSNLFEAEESCGLWAKREEKACVSGKLPVYSEFDSTCSNPVVLRVMAQVRRVVNAVCREYGTPDAVRIELARELKQSKKEKDRISANNKARFDTREALRKRIAEDLHCDADDRNVSRLLRKAELAREQSEICPYCGRHLEYEELIQDETRFQIDHILPYSRTCDDGRANKVLVHFSCNEEKGNRTPYEWLKGKGLWDEYCLRVKRIGTISSSKRAKLLNTDLVERESQFINRNLNDTRYASKSAKAYIESNLAFPDDGKQHVFAVAGGATAALRGAWGIRKDRAADNLHHAVDAAVIAACTPSIVQSIARASELRSKTPHSSRPALFQTTQPWEGFVDDLLDMAARVIPTRKTRHEVTGRVFEDTLYRYCGLNEKKTKGILEVSKRDSAGNRKVTSKPSGNYRTFEDGSARIVDGLAFLRLWWDISVKVRGRKEPGCYLMEPVYYADIPFLDNGYEPKVIPPQTSKRPRELWDPVPETAAETEPLVLFSGDMLCVNGEYKRFSGVDIAACAWKLTDPITGSDATKGFPLSSVVKPEDLRVVHEDILGRCFHSLKG